MDDKNFYNNIFSNARFIANLARDVRTDIYKIFLREACPTAETTILDAGVSVTEEHKIEENILEKLYPYPQRITMLGIHEGKFLEQIYPGSSYVRHHPPAPFPFQDDAFDMCFSYAVLEHVGEQKEQREFIHELLRVASRVFLTTPNRAYPIDFHKMYPFLHWLPMNWYRFILRLFGDRFYSRKENLNLLYKRDLIRLFRSEKARFRVLPYRWFGLNPYLIVFAEKISTNDNPL